MLPDDATHGPEPPSRCLEVGRATGSDDTVGPMELSVARKMWLLLEPIHGFIYFVPEAPARYEALGLERIAYYFASRSAAMGAVEHGVVAATFYNFSPGLVKRAMRDAWSTTTPSEVIEARYAAVDDVLTRVWSDVNPDAILEAAILAMEAASACRPHGRPLFAGHASQPTPEPAHLQLWHGLTLLREHRGDGHVAALQAFDFGPLDALLTSADYSVLSIDQLETLRGWREHEWQAARQDLIERGWLDINGRRTDLGTEHRTAMETVTDRQASDPWDHLGDERTARLEQLLTPMRTAILSKTDLPGSY